MSPRALWVLVVPFVTSISILLITLLNAILLRPSALNFSQQMIAVILQVAGALFAVLYARRFGCYAWPSVVYLLVSIPHAVAGVIIAAHTGVSVAGQPYWYILIWDLDNWFLVISPVLALILGLVSVLSCDPAVDRADDSQ